MTTSTTALMRADLACPPPEGLAPLIEALRARWGDALEAIVLYGSTRRAADPSDGLVDLMALVRDYTSAHGRRPAALFNRLLPPNVYYLEAGDQLRLRCKYMVVSRHSFDRRTAGGLDGYFWARFSQPCRCVWAREPGIVDWLAERRARAARRFASAAAGLGNDTLDARAFWIRALGASYGCELRPEPPGAAERLVDHDLAYWQTLSRALLPSLDGVVADAEAWRIDLGHAARLRAALAWRARRWWSRLLNVLRLFKAAGTFANGVDYLSWKLERHSGIRVDPTERMRRHPRLASWGLLVRLIRSGALR